MPEFKTARQRFMQARKKPILMKKRTSIISKGKAAILDMKQKPISKHKQPSLYVEDKIEKRKS
jgi:hypothetical protein